MIKKSRRYRRRKSHHFRRALTAMLGATLLAFGIATWLPTRNEPVRKRASTVPVEPAAEERRPRPVYPYSVIPGGVRDADELTSALARDPVARRHYAGFRAESAVLTLVREDRPVYVSYRLHDKIYWTARKVRLTHGEYLITDGEHVARARCGNRVSEIPQRPTSGAEPAEAAMDWQPPETAMLPDYTAEMEPPAELSEMPGAQELLPFSVPPIPAIVSYFQQQPIDRLQRVQVEYRPWIGTPTPEPSTYLLIGCGLALLIYRRARTS